MHDMLDFPHKWGTWSITASRRCVLGGYERLLVFPHSTFAGQLSLMTLNRLKTLSMSQFALIPISSTEILDT